MRIIINYSVDNISYHINKLIKLLILLLDMVMHGNHLLLMDIIFLLKFFKLVNKHIGMIILGVSNTWLLFYRFLKP